jgi:hypothetical protein
VRAAILDDGTTWRYSLWFNISDAPHSFEVDWKAATAPGANNGSLTFWIDGTQRSQILNVDNDTRQINRVRLGAISNIDTGTRGAFYFDAFEARRNNYIGPAAGAVMAAGEVPDLVDLYAWTEEEMTAEDRQQLLEEEQSDTPRLYLPALNR